MTFEQKLEEIGGWPRRVLGRAFCAEETASAKALKLEPAICVSTAARRPVWL